MNIRKFVLLFLCAFSICPVYSRENAEFNVATYNIRLLNDGDSIQGDGWYQRGPVVAQLIKYHDFDIFGTQEGYKRQLEDIKNSLTGYDYIGVARDDGKESGEHCAIFYDTSRFDLIDHGDFWLSEHPESPGLGWDAACNRICTWGIFRDKESGKIFQFYNLHLDHIGETAREEGIKLVQKVMKEKGYDLPTFLTGDFNVDQHNRLFKLLESNEYLKDSYIKSPEVYALNGTYNDFKTGDWNDSRIDHIFVTNDIDVMKYGILTDTYRAIGKDGKYESHSPSDHFPVAIRVSF